MCSRGVLVHYFSRLGATTAVQAAELPRGDGVPTQYALERAETLHHCDAVMSHIFKYTRSFRSDSELKLPSDPFSHNQTHSQPHLRMSGSTQEPLHEERVSG
jgi:hypothetical protein